MWTILRPITKFSGRTSMRDLVIIGTVASFPVRLPSAWARIPDRLVWSRSTPPSLETMRDHPLELMVTDTDIACSGSDCAKRFLIIRLVHVQGSTDFVSRSRNERSCHLGRLLYKEPCDWHGYAIATIIFRSS